MLLALLMSSFLVSILFVYSQFGGNAELPAECALVFGSAVVRGGEAGRGMRRRMEAAAELYRGGSVRRIILSGGRGEGNTVSEAEVMQQEGRRLGIRENDMQREKLSQSTWENIKFAQPLLQGCSSTVAISDRYHLARIRLTAWKLDVKLGAFPADATTDPLFELQAVLREALGNLLYLTRSSS